VGRRAEYLDRFVEHHRLTASPATIVEFRRMQIELDISDVLPAIRVPTLVLDKRPMESRSAKVAAAIPGAEYLEIPGEGFAIWENDFAVEAIEAFLGGSQSKRVPDTVLATLLFTDLAGSTARATELGDRAWRERSPSSALAFAGSSSATGGRSWIRRETASSRGSTARARLLCARTVADATRELGLDVRSGIHTGECELVEGKPAGLSVHVGARICANAGPGEVLVSGTVKDLVAGSDIAFEERGEHELKGVPGTWRLYAVAGG
jgi:class 3 adenylate cyclase